MATRFSLLPLALLLVCCGEKDSRSAGAPEASRYEGTTGSIHGIVVDSEGLPVPGATLSLIHENYARPQEYDVTTTSSDDGSFTFEPLPAGSYTVRFLSARNTHPKSSARPISGINSLETGSAPTKLQLEPWVEVDLPFSGDPKSAHLIPIYRQDPLNPLVNGVAHRGIISDRGAKSLKIRTLPGTLQISTDPSFQEATEIHTFEVGPEGLTSSQSSLPYPELSKIEVQLARSDGKALGPYSVMLVPAWIPAESVVPITLGGSSRLSRDGLFTSSLPKGQCFKAVAVAKGCAISESRVFVSGAASEPIEVVLNPADPASLKFSLTGLPEEVLGKVGPEDFTLWFRSPGGQYVQASQGWQLTESSEGTMSFDALPPGETVLVRFWRGGPTRYLARARLTNTEGAHQKLPALTIEEESPEEPSLWNNQWWLDRYPLGKYYWRVPVAPPHWFEATDD